MKLNTMPIEMAAELIAFVADKEDFCAAAEALKGSVSAEQIRALLREISRELLSEVKVDKGEEYDVEKCSFLSKDTKKIISCLSPREEKTLLKVFGFYEEVEK